MNKAIIKFIRYGIKSVNVLLMQGPSELSRRIDRKIHEGHMVMDQNERYKLWIKNVESKYLSTELKVYKKRMDKFKYLPKISILMPVYNIEYELIGKAVESIRSQWYPNWELCLNDDCSTNPNTTKFLNDLSKSQEYKSGQIKIRYSKKNENISCATNHAFDISTGKYLLLMDNDDILRSNALYEVVKVLNDAGRQDLIYYDEDKIEMNGDRVEVLLRTGFSRELLWSMMYPTHAVFSRDIFSKAGKLRAGYEGSQDFDLVLRVVELTGKIHHIPKVLYSWKKVPGSTSIGLTNKSYAMLAAKKSLESAVKRSKYTADVIGGLYPFITDFKPDKKYIVNVIICFNNDLKIIKSLLTSIEKKNTWENTVITIVYSNPTSTGIKSRLKSMLGLYRSNTNIIHYPKPYNQAGMRNMAVLKSVSEFILFVNSNIKISTQGFIEKMIGYSQQENIGPVGAKILSNTSTIKYAGIVLGYGDIAGLAFYGLTNDNSFYFNSINAVRNYMAVSSSVMMIKRSKFNSINGFNERVMQWFSDIDLCLRLYEEGSRSVYIPHVETICSGDLYTLQEDNTTDETFMKDNWQKYIDDDPFYSRNMEKSKEDGVAFSVRLK